MADLTREQIIDWRNDICPENGWVGKDIAELHALCDMALRAAEAEKNYETAVQGRQDFRRAYRRAREALQVADAAINPPDRSGISLHEWNERLKAATATIRAALSPPQEEKK